MNMIFFYAGLTIVFILAMAAGIVVAFSLYFIAGGKHD